MTTYKRERTERKKEKRKKGWIDYTKLEIDYT